MRLEGQLKLTGVAFIGKIEHLSCWTLRCDVPKGFAYIVYVNGGQFQVRRPQELHLLAQVTIHCAANQPWSLKKQTGI